MPTKYDLDETELHRIEELAKLRLEDATEDLEEAERAHVDDSDGDGEEAKPTKKAAGMAKAKTGCAYMHAIWGLGVCSTVLYTDTL